MSEEERHGIECGPKLDKFAACSILIALLVEPLPTFKQGRLPCIWFTDFWQVRDVQWRDRSYIHERRRLVDPSALYIKATPVYDPIEEANWQSATPNSFRRVSSQAQVLAWKTVHSMCQTTFQSSPPTSRWWSEKRSTCVLGP